MAIRNYSDYVFPTTLSTSMDSSITTMTLGSLTNLPTSYPYTMLLDWGTASQEVVLVTGLSSGTTVNVTRGFDGKTPFAHSAGAIVVHGVCQVDFSEANTHVNTFLSGSSGVHGSYSATLASNYVASSTSLTNFLSTPSLPIGMYTFQLFGRIQGTNQTSPPTNGYRLTFNSDGTVTAIHWSREVSGGTFGASAAGQSDSVVTTHYNTSSAAGTVVLPSSGAYYNVYMKGFLNISTAGALNLRIANTGSSAMTVEANTLLTAQRIS